MLKVIDIEAWVVVILDGFNNWKVSFSDPVHKFL